ncbi:hypothetical protein BQ8794_100053 [Mesorhizobium prunaredense]|uniref:Uncharacterized protein n=1 Tax=Mesorhizobium prunaredense TaxID=1631249 RepID=A0A1R3UZV7_9HYPH|nr:hypothetical protein [Mesorhizobium prunaredense]SIT53162.1 hypothetical protein BQ8794_100053 [Mesorhizobium prunaredense]
MTISIIRYFSDKILMRVDFLEDLLARRGDAIYGEVERLAAKKTDPVWAKFLRETAAPSSILSHLRKVRDLLDRADLVEADMELERLNNNLAAVEQINQQPYFRAKSGGHKGGLADKTRKWAKLLAAEIYGPGKKETSWLSIPDSFEDERIIETTERDYLFYRDGDRVVCKDANTGAEIDSMSKANFLGRYLTQKSVKGA